MRKRKVWISALLIVALAFGCMSVVGCGDAENKQSEAQAKDVTAEVNEEFDLYTLSTEPYTEFEIAKGGKKYPVTSSVFRFPETGVYSVRVGDTGRWRITVVDTTAPVAHILGDYSRIVEGSVIDLSDIRIKDNGDDSVTDYSFKVVCGEEEIEIADNKFAAMTRGEYTLTVTAKDGTGNDGTTEKKFTVYPAEPIKANGKTDQFVAAGTKIELGEHGIENYLTVAPLKAEHSTFTYDKVLKNGVVQQSTGGAPASFIVEENDIWEVFVTYKDDDGCESKSYMQFADSALSGHFISLNDRAWDVVYANANQLFLSPAGGSWQNGYIDLYNISKYEIMRDEYGKTSVRAWYRSGFEFTVHPVAGKLPKMIASLRIGGEIENDATLCSIRITSAPKVTWKTDGVYNEQNTKTGSRDEFTQIYASELKYGRVDGVDSNLFGDRTVWESNTETLYLEIDKIILWE